ncbi:NAD-dependent epimerase/dehydratase family protein [Nonomuraea typhae]|uniref:NAD-dependent epimerase/dehydratase family protein n=1 Tax=Nonomuraea typhae TaxID=2603600 RepID=UPI0015E21FE0|nr:NAD-dependent epimerase/dehydratase family protein [Nonomuraea typhae]
MKLLVLGGTHHVGRAVVESALARGDEVTTLNRGVSRPPAPGVRALIADRTDPAAMKAALDGGAWDVVIDTWYLAPRVVRDSARLLADRARHYVYVSTRGVYSWPWAPGDDESAALVDGDPDSEDGSDYAAAKRGGELAVLESFGERSLLARAGMILGPYENVGRIPWWLRRLEKGGRVLAPDPRDTPLQYLDVRDMADWLVGSAERRLGGSYIVTGRPDDITVEELLTTAMEVTGSTAELVWTPYDVLAGEGLGLGRELSMYMPDGSRPVGINDADTSAVFDAGLTVRPLRDTLADTWAWLQAEGDPPPHPLGTDPSNWTDPVAEQRLLARL